MFTHISWWRLPLVIPLFILLYIFAWPAALLAWCYDIVSGTKPQETDNTSDQEDEAFANSGDPYQRDFADDDYDDDDDDPYGLPLTISE